MSPSLRAKRSDPGPRNLSGIFVASLLAITEKHSLILSAAFGVSLQEKRPGSLPAFAFVPFASVRSALRRRGRPRLDQRVVVDGFALWLLVRQLALGRDVAVLGRLREPELG